MTGDKRIGLLVLATALAALACGPTTPPTAPAATEVPTEEGAEPTRPATDPPPTNTSSPPTPVLDVPTEFEDAGRTLYLASESVRVGVDTRWGGAIREIWFQGENLVNNYDGGRLIAVALYDSGRPATTSHPNDTGWNPTPSDMYDHANPPLESSYEHGTLYLKHRYLQWFPNDKGGGPGLAVETDIIVESWLRFFTNPHLVELRYRITNESDQHHSVHAQEFPFAYVRTPYHRYVTYRGNRPWRDDDVTGLDVPMDRAAGDVTVATERWAGLFDQDGHGLTLWAPQAYPNFSYKHFNNSGPPENDSLYLQPRTFLAIEPQGTIETRVYLLLGTWPQARANIYLLNESFSYADIMHPYGFLDSVAPGAELSGTIDIAGWAIDDRGLERVEIRLDGEVIGRAEYGSPRPDVQENYPGLPGAPNYGYHYRLDTTALTAGDHALAVLAVDQAGNASTLRPGEFTITVDR